MSIFKRFMAPIQARVLDKGMCPACTRTLNGQKNREPITTETELVTCECGRQFVYNRPHRKYRRAEIEEVNRIVTPTGTFRYVTSQTEGQNSN